MFTQYKSIVSLFQSSEWLVSHFDDMDFVTLKLNPALRYVIDSTLRNVELIRNHIYSLPYAENN